MASLEGAIVVYGELETEVVRRLLRPQRKWSALIKQWTGNQVVFRDQSDAVEFFQAFTDSSRSWARREKFFNKPRNRFKKRRDWGQSA